MQILTLLALSLGTAQAEPMTEEAAAELVQAVELPTQANNYRKSGADEAQTRVALQAMEEAKVPASQAADAVGSAAKDAEETGPTDNFGAFVQTQLAEGKRGKDLSDAIHAEHKANGKGNPENPGKSGEKGNGAEKGDGAENGNGAGNGKGAEKGKGVSKGDEKAGGNTSGGVSKGGEKAGGNTSGGVSKGGEKAGGEKASGEKAGGGNTSGGVSKGGEKGGSKGGGNTGGGVSKGGGQ